MKKIYLFVFLGISSLAFAGSPLLIEDFDYPVNDLITGHGWLNHSGTTNPILVTSPGLTFTGYVGSGIGLAAGLNNTTEKDNKQFGAQTSACIIYASFLVNCTVTVAAGDCFFHIWDNTLGSPSTFRGKVYLGNHATAGKMKVGLAYSSTSATYSATEFNFGETYLFVLKYNIIDGALNDQVSLYVFKAGDSFITEPSTTTLGPLSDGAVADFANPSSVALRQFNAAQRITVDGIRVRKEWDMVDDSNVVTAMSSLNDNQSLVCYPNPVNDGFVNLGNIASTMKDVQIFDVVGKKVLTQQSISNRLDVSALNSGIYVLKVSADNHTSSSRLVIK